MEDFLFTLLATGAALMSRGAAGEFARGGGKTAFEALRARLEKKHDVKTLALLQDAAANPVFAELVKSDLARPSIEKDNQIRRLAEQMRAAIEALPERVQAEYRIDKDEIRAGKGVLAGRIRSDRVKKTPARGSRTTRRGKSSGSGRLLKRAGVGLVGLGLIAGAAFAALTFLNGSGLRIDRDRMLALTEQVERDFTVLTERVDQVVTAVPERVEQAATAVSERVEQAVIAVTERVANQDTNETAERAEATETPEQTEEPDPVETTEVNILPDGAKTADASEPGQAAADEAARERAIALREIAESRVAQGDLPGAVDAYGESLGVLLDLSVREPENAAAEWDVVLAYWNLAQVDTGNAAAHWSEVVVRMEKMQAEGTLYPSNLQYLDTARRNLAAAGG